MRQVLHSRPVKRGLLLLMTTLLAGLSPAGAEERVGDQERARKLVNTVLRVEATKKRPWNGIRWRPSVKAAVAEAQRTGKPLFVYFYVDHGGPPMEPC